MQIHLGIARPESECNLGYFHYFWILLNLFSTSAKRFSLINDVWQSSVVWQSAFGCNLSPRQLSDSGIGREEVQNHFFT